MARRDRAIEITIALGALVPGRAIAAAAPRSTVAALLTAAIAFSVAVHLGPRERSIDHEELTLLGALLLPGVVGATALEQIGAPLLLENVLLGLILLSVVVALADARGFITVPRRIRERGQRRLALPWIALLAACFSAGLDFAAGKLQTEEDLGFVVFILGLIVPMFFGLLVVAPAKLIDQAAVSRGRWIARYGLAVLSAMVSATAMSRLGGASP
ncbi:MAG: hypothetical protein R3B09_08630 [Nannocystaceae bacterium]